MIDRLGTPSFDKFINHQGSLYPYASAITHNFQSISNLQSAGTFRVANNAGVAHTFPIS